MKKIYIIGLLLALYLYLLFKILVFKDLPEIEIGHLKFRMGGTQSGDGNWVPLKTIIPYFLGKKGLLIGGLNIVGNIGLLMPLGYILPFLYRSVKWAKMIFFAITFSFLIEGIQSFYQIGIFDIDDVILNSIGILLGFQIYLLFKKE